MLYYLIGVNPQEWVRLSKLYSYISESKIQGLTDVFFS